jgi:hypothetical protein
MAGQIEEAHKECAMVGDRLPPPSAMQRLVQVYKLLWKWR